jgi:hypothetical protein
LHPDPSEPLEPSVKSGDRARVRETAAAESPIAARVRTIVQPLQDLGIAEGIAKFAAMHPSLKDTLTPETIPRLQIWMDTKRQQRKNPGAILTACLKAGHLPDDLPPPPKPKEPTGIVDGVIVDRGAYDRYMAKRQREMGYA